MKNKEFVKYTGRIVSVGTALILSYWLVMVGMGVRTYIYNQTNVEVTE